MVLRQTEAGLCNVLSTSHCDSSACCPWTTSWEHVLTSASQYGKQQRLLQIHKFLYLHPDQKHGTKDHHQAASHCDSRLALKMSDQIPIVLDNGTGFVKACFLSDGADCGSLAMQGPTFQNTRSPRSSAAQFSALRSG